MIFVAATFLVLSLIFRLLIYYTNFTHISWSVKVESYVNTYPFRG